MEEEKVYTEAQVRSIALEFFYWWFNAPGNNTEQGFDDWWTLNKEMK